MSSPRILFIDAYDSFSNNIIALLGSTLDARVTVIRIDDTRFISHDSTFHHYISQFDGVVAGPGPGDPRNPSDLGLIAKLWTLPDEILIPVFGVCLGFQSLVFAFGGSVERLNEPRHGFVTPITHDGQSLFEGLGAVEATQYHSLHATLHQWEAFSPKAGLWKITEACPQLEPLAWDLSDNDNGPILMAVKHAVKPFWGVQYHPESICTNAAGGEVIRNWWSEASEWIQALQSARRGTVPIKHAAVESAEVGGLGALDNDATGFTSSRTSMDADGLSSPEVGTSSASSVSSVHIEENISQQPVKVVWKCLDIAESALDVVDVVEMVKTPGHKALLLESGTKNGEPVRAETGRFSIIGCHDQQATTYRYSTNTHVLETTTNSGTQSASATIDDVWDRLRSFQHEHRAIGGPSNVPFWGGLVGYISYEAGLETIDVAPPSQDGQYPDVWFVHVERSIVVDHVDKKLYLQSLGIKDDGWMSAMQILVQKHNSARCTAARKDQKKQPVVPTKQISGPSRTEYSNKVRACQSHIRAGSSYELCLTDQTVLRYPENAAAPPDPWSLYLGLRSTNPAPFGAYLSLSKPNNVDDAGSSGQDIAILSSSPERFLSWSRGGRCQFRPIKGTVKKSAEMTRDIAEAILKSRKEQAENLMIVDLIRHDLQGVIGRNAVRVEKLMQVEEYETVFQLVSVIEGQVLDDVSYSGVDVLAASLPPGSMTGAPKKRSCELLKEIEGGVPRGIYSGVLGYLDVGGGGDFSVVIRTAVQWKGETRIGAGGAVTALSTPEGEYEEMLAKRESCLP